MDEPEAGGKKAPAARLLGIDVKTLTHKIRIYNIRFSPGRNSLPSRNSLHLRPASHPCGSLFGSGETCKASTLREQSGALGSQEGPGMVLAPSRWYIMVMAYIGGRGPEPVPIRTELDRREGAE
ncbi:MAG: hypothetical protein U1B94_06325 [candidate division NC10 bacterium]|nr:hypothetical protein [candidate division NC10 bacterium]